MTKHFIIGHCTWLHLPGAHLLGDTVHIMTRTSRRKATVVGIKPGLVFVRWG